MQNPLPRVLSPELAKMALDGGITGFKRGEPGASAGLTPQRRRPRLALQDDFRASSVAAWSITLRKEPAGTLLDTPHTDPPLPTGLV